MYIEHRNLYNKSKNTLEILLKLFKVVAKITPKTKRLKRSFHWHPEFNYSNVPSSVLAESGLKESLRPLRVLRPPMELPLPSLGSMLTSGLKNGLEPRRPICKRG